MELVVDNFIVGVERSSYIGKRSMVISLPSLSLCAVGHEPAPLIIYVKHVIDTNNIVEKLAEERSSMSEANCHL